MSNKDYFQNSNKVHDYADIHDNMDILEDMIVTIVEWLEEKNIITFFEWKERMIIKMREVKKNNNNNDTRL